MGADYKQLRVEDTFGFVHTVGRKCASCETEYKYNISSGPPGMIVYMGEDSKKHKKGEYFICYECLLSKLGVEPNKEAE